MSMLTHMCNGMNRLLLVPDIWRFNITGTTPEDKPFLTQDWVCEFTELTPKCVALHSLHNTRSEDIPERFRKQSMCAVVLDLIVPFDERLGALRLAPLLTCACVCCPATRALSCYQSLLAASASQGTHCHPRCSPTSTRSLASRFSRLVTTTVRPRL